MLETIAGAAKTSGTIVSYGFLLAIGFWGGKQLTNVADEAILKYRIRKQLEKEAKAAAFQPNAAETVAATAANTAAAAVQLADDAARLANASHPINP
jgi:hypothetical protein